MFQHEAVAELKALIGTVNNFRAEPWQEVPGSLGLRYYHDASGGEVIITNEGRLVVISERYLTQPVAFDIRADQELDREIETLLVGLARGSSERLLKVLSADDIKFVV